jgi:hypothetical protein
MHKLGKFSVIHLTHYLKIRYTFENHARNHRARSKSKIV